MPIDDEVMIGAAEESQGEPGVQHHLETGGMPFGEVPMTSPEGSRTLWSDAWYRLSRNRLAVAALIYLAVVTLLAVTAPLWATRLFGDPLFVDTTTVMKTRFLPPSFSHPMGTDDFGRDMFSRLVYGARISLTVGILATFISVVLGLIFGALSGYYGGVTDSVVMRLTDVFLAFPYILLAILLIALMGMGLGPVLVAIGILGWTTIARVFRSSILSVKQNDYIEAARAMGASDVRIMTQAHPAERARADHRLRDHVTGWRDPDRSRAVLPRRGHSAPDTVVGPHAQRGTGLRRDAPGALHLARRCHHLHGAGVRAAR